MDRSGLDRAFHARTVAVVGDKRANGYLFLKALKAFQGKVYSVQIDPQELSGIQELGFPNYSSLQEVPEPVDYVICAVPRAASVRIVKDCIQKGVGAVHLFTSGFAETGTEEGKRLQDEIARLAREANLNLIGPNCMGLYNPSIGLRFGSDLYVGEGGQVGVIAQSGTHMSHFGIIGPSYGVITTLGVSYGNAVVLDSPDFLELLNRDPRTKAIALYVESVKDGRRFFRALKEASRERPVVIWKGGETEAGTRAAFSHTAALAESPLIWEALTRQTGALRVRGLEEMLDVLQALLFLPPPRGYRVGLVAMSGGQSVVITDTFARAGLQVPTLTPRSYQELASFYTIIGGSYRNPFDFNWLMNPLDSLWRSLGVIERDENIDAIVLELWVRFVLGRWERDPGFLDGLVERLSELRGKSRKPLMLVLTAGQHEGPALDIREKLVRQGFPCYLSFQRAARALKQVADYYSFRRQRGQ